MVRGEGAGKSIARPDGGGEPIRLGRGAGNDLVLETSHVSSEHARVVWTGEHFVLQDLKSTNGTVVLRRGERVRLDDTNARQLKLESGDVLELGVPEQAAVLAVVVEEDPDATQVMAVRSIDDLLPAVVEMEKQPSLLRSVYEATTRIGGALELDEVLRRAGEAVLGLVAKATHVTFALRDDDAADEPGAAASYIPVYTRVRGETSSGAIPITRSIFRKVVQERAAVLAADAPSEVGSASLLGAQIRSTLGIPLWRGEDILGILQVDNRSVGAAASSATAMGATPFTSALFTSADLDLLSVLAQQVSLAVANARLIHRLRIAEERARKENTYLKTREERREGRREILGSSRPMADLKDKIEKVVNTRVTVLVEGETGVGKELIASAVHYRSNRRDKLFVAQNCAALPENLLESELFGHKKGAFTGATDDKRGLFELADGGTLFLDEIGEMSLNLQSKLLRALQEGEIPPARRHQGAARQRAHRHRDQPRPQEGGRREALPRGSVLPAQRHPAPRAVAPRAPRGHPAPRRVLPTEVRPRRSARASPASASRRWSCSRPTTGRATSASSRTRSSASSSRSIPAGSPPPISSPRASARSTAWSTARRPRRARSRR